MPGMSPGPKTNNSNIVAVFHSALLHQGLVVLLILAVAGVTLNVRRTQQFRRARGDDGPPAPRPSGRLRQPSARRLLRISFGLIFVLEKSATVLMPGRPGQHEDGLDLEWGSYDWMQGQVGHVNFKLASS